MKKIEYDKNAKSPLGKVISDCANAINELIDKVEPECNDSRLNGYRLDELVRLEKNKTPICTLDYLLGRMWTVSHA